MYKKHVERVPNTSSSGEDENYLQHNGHTNPGSIKGGFPRPFDHQKAKNKREIIYEFSTESSSEDEKCASCDHKKKSEKKFSNILKRVPNTSTSSVDKDVKRTCEYCRKENEIDEIVKRCNKRQNGLLEPDPEA